VKTYRLVALRVLTPLIAVAFAAAVGSVVIVAIGKDPIAVYATMFRFNFRRVDSVAAILFKATPLLYAGLACALAFRLFIFNIGVEGQYLFATFCAAWAGFALRGLPAVIHLPLVLAVAVLGGLAWALLPALLKVRRGAHEVITTIMLNYVAFSLVHYLIADVFLDPAQDTGAGFGSARVRMPELQPSARMPTLHGLLGPLGIDLPGHIYLNWFFILGILLAVGLFVLIWTTSFGYEMRVVAENPDAAEAAGIDVKGMYLKAFLLSGAVAGLVGLSDLTAYFGYLDIDFPRGYGFNGIAVALLGRNDPLGVVAAALLFGFLERGAEGVQALAGVPMEVITILESVMILSIVVAYEVASRYVRAHTQREAA